MTYARATYLRGDIAIVRAETVQAHRAALLGPGHHAVARGGVVLSWSYEVPDAIRAELRRVLEADAIARGEHTPHAYDHPTEVREACDRAALARRRKSVAIYAMRRAGAR